VPDGQTEIIERNNQMHRKLKALSVALVALFVLGAVAASSAFAVEGSITPEAFPATITASQIGANTFVIGNAGARTVSCSVVHGDSTSVTKAAASEVILGIEYGGCITSPGGGPATVSATGCDLTFTATNRLNAASGEGSGKLEGTSCDLTIVANSTAGSKFCEYTVANQAAAGWILWASSPADVTLSLNNIQVNVNVLFGTLAACGASAGNATIGKLRGEVTVTAEVAGVVTNLIIS
jgi:hypothetical protein